MESQRPLATVIEVAKYLNVSRALVYQLMQGQIPYVKIGRCRRIRWEDVEKYVERQRIGV